MTASTANNEWWEDSADEEKSGKDCVYHEDDGIELEYDGPLGVHEFFTYLYPTARIIESHFRCLGLTKVRFRPARKAKLLVKIFIVL